MPAEIESASHCSLHRMRFGAELRRDGVRFRLFAPAVSDVRLELDEQQPNAPALLTMHTGGDGWHELVVAKAHAGMRYQFVLPDGSRVPDPVSRFQPGGVHGASEVVDPCSFEWSDGAWRGRPWHEAVLYELHVGAFTPEGTLRAAAEKLEHLAALGVTAIELMGVNAFPGQRSWGYDGVLLFAPNNTYGCPDDLKAFVDAAHRRGLMVILDVVYNHFGPEGNYLPKYWPQIFTTEHKTAWGEALNFDGVQSREVRELIIENALYWIEEFHMDGLRLDASHAMIDESEPHILTELAERVREAAGERAVHLILESEQRIGRLLRRREDGGVAAYTAQWNHAIDHLLGLGMRSSCRDEDALRQTEELAKALAEGFVAGDATCAAQEAGVRVPPTAYVGFIQTHDLVGNRIFGERIHAITSMEAVRAIAAVYLLLPQIPMLFMGEEWAATSPFPFFSDFGGELADAVRRGRQEQMKKDSHASEEELRRAPDPQAESTFQSAKLNWKETAYSPHREQLAWYREVLAVRRERIVPLLDGPVEGCGRYEVLAAGRIHVEWTLRGAVLTIDANLCSEGFSEFAQPRGERIWLEGEEKSPVELGAWTVRCAVAFHGYQRIVDELTYKREP